MAEETKIPNNSEIDQALKQFEMESGSVQQPQEVISKTSDVPKMVGLVMKWSGGAIKEQRTAEYVLLGLVVLMFAVSFYLFFGGGNTEPTASPDDFLLTPPAMFPS